MMLSDLTVCSAVEALQAGKFSAVELAKAVLATIQERDPLVGAYLDVDAEDVLAQAVEADAQRQSNRGECARLTGIPIALKDIISVAGQPCSCGSKIMQGYIAPYDATLVSRLRSAGVVFAGRTNLDEFAMGTTTENSALQITRNPHDLDRVPGGSSGGSAAAVAQGMALAAIGSDTGGSIRQPAAFCGCVGLKPSYGRVSRYGLISYAPSLDQAGPMTQTVADAALLLQHMAGWDPCDNTSVKEALPDYMTALQGGIKGLRIGVPREYFSVAGSDPEVLAAVRKTIDLCASSGAEIVELSLPHTEYGVAVYCVIATAEAASSLARFDGVRFGRRAQDVETMSELYANSRGAGFGPEVKRRMIMGTFMLGSNNYQRYFVHAQRVRQLIRQEFETAFAQCDVLMTPVAPAAAQKLGTASDDPLQMYLSDMLTVPANLAGICGLSLPCGKTSDNLPVGLQILGPALGESQILQAGQGVEELLK